MPILLILSAFFGLFLEVKTGNKAGFKLFIVNYYFICDYLSIKKAAINAANLIVFVNYYVSLRRVTIDDKYIYIYM